MLRNNILGVKHSYKLTEASLIVNGPRAKTRRTGCPLQYFENNAVRTVRSISGRPSSELLYQFCLASINGCTISKEIVYDGQSTN